MLHIHSRILSHDKGQQSTSPRVHVYRIPESRTTTPSNLKYALSFLPSSDLPDKTSVFDHPDLIIGWTPEQTTLDPKSFVDNNQFVQFMTKVLKDNIHNINDNALKGLAEWQKEGWLHVADERNPPPWGRIPFPEDIIGSVLIKDGVIQPNTFEAMPTHRLVTSCGIFKLSEPLFQCLLKESKKKAQA
ncbi:hypothetical protein PHYBLDRAFT_71708 [Phycomyces blakesleeanus NRRL 1555(-)]|uniref:Uncharacterized protein n=1 Tax=Phycomyces blakesleeanus (strain ATCC 8743b / DSM 1359 / FGSC 10004 / NBRC 33097 / NRRL 1555) TaxID=763407 RepID=A0A167PNA8_PHYB8|nr:hypothetical protein PHYBLDRAFT_71708 [Phycomyces blakesleeanus NRRL 1555(-)]OAD78248.1 hypothetical protein PHYBLDRAFT_71708 [Phycomyces blakesleeanus NRRL 1555(-)]|eukprot:XP_018296288.1 hypothetical protein PHYBLDRAFT_71708 [Phycomyces blakesleeanus NRRL 1555(-)]